MNPSFFLLIVLNLQVLNLSPVEASDSLVVELKDPKVFRQQLEDAFQQTSLTSLTINLQENRGWVVFAQFPDRSDIENNPSYSLKHKVEKLPETLGGLNHLEKLEISFLGLNTLPQSIVRLVALEELDISYNQLDFSLEAEKIKQLSKLRLLKAYGCGVTEEQVEFLKKANPRLKILYTRQHHFEEFNLSSENK